jgi:hypothetical protein
MAGQRTAGQGNQSWREAQERRIDLKTSVVFDESKFPELIHENIGQ